MMSAIRDTRKYRRQNPFYDDPLQKAFYHPSLPRKLNHKTKQTIVGVEQVQPNHETADDGKVDRFPDDGVTGYHMSAVGELGLSPHGDSIIFDESWPQSERPSSLSIPDVDDAMSSSSVSPAKRNVFRKKEDRSSSGGNLDLEKDGKLPQKKSSKPERDLQHGETSSTLSKYIDRFRNGTPTSREERRRVKEAAVGDDDFWWCNSPAARLLSPADSARLYAENTDQRGEAAAIKRQKENQEESPSDADIFDKESRFLHGKIDAVLEKLSNCSMGSSLPVVSTVGLGSDNSSSNAATFDEEPSRPAFTKTRPEPERKVLSKPIDPESDPLVKWRIRRRAEKFAADAGSPSRTTPAEHLALINELNRLKGNAPTSVAPTNVSRPLVISEQTTASQPILVDQPIIPKQDAVVQTSESLEEQEEDARVTYIPIACPHLAPSASSGRPLSLVKPHCHLSCDILTLAERKPQAGKSKPKETKLSDEERQTYLRIREDQAHVTDDGGGVQRRRKANKERDEEIVPEKDSNKTTDLREHQPHIQRRLPGKKVRAEKPSKEKPKSHLEENSHDVLDARHEDLGDTDVWSPTDRGQLSQAERCDGMSEEEQRRSSATVSRVIKDAAAVPREKNAAGRRATLPKPKNPSVSPMPIRSTVSQVINERLLAGSLDSSIDIFEVSSLDATDMTEPEIPVHDISSSNLQHHNGAVDVESFDWSDGEEFKDDDILCNLRHRRSVCLHRLRDLDQIVHDSRPDQV